MSEFVLRTTAPGRKFFLRRCLRNCLGFMGRLRLRKRGSGLGGSVRR